MSLSNSQVAVEPEPAPTELTIGSPSVVFTGDNLRLGNGGSSNQTHLYYLPRMWYNDGKTYLIYGGSDSVLPYIQARLLVYDDQKGFDVPVTIGNVPSAAETHNIPTLILDSGFIYVVQENLHDSPLRTYKSLANYDYAYFSQPFDIGSVLSYPHFIKRSNGTWVAWCRGHISPTSGFYSIWICESTSGFETWGSQIQVTAKPVGDSPMRRHYPFLPFGRDRYTHEGTVEHIVSWASRKDDIATGSGWFYRFYSARTSDFRTFTNLERTYSRHIVTDGVLTDAISQTNFLTHEMATDETQGYPPVGSYSDVGNYYQIIRNADASGFSFKYFDGSWNTKALVVSNIAVFTNTNPFFNLTVKSDDEIYVIANIDTGSGSRPHWLKTTDKGTSWVDLGDLSVGITESTFLLFPNNGINIPSHKNFPAYFSYVDPVLTGFKGLVCKQAAFGAIQSVPGVTIGPAATMNYSSTGLFHYKCDNANLTKTGNNVTALVDLFGIRNAACANNPQWNGSDTVTFLSASSQRAKPATPASLVNKTALTFMCVCQFSAGVNTHMLSFTTLANKKSSMSFRMVVANIFGTHPATFCSQIDKGEAIDNASAFGQDDISTGTHLVTIELDGRARLTIGIDGKDQFFQNFGVDTVEEWEMYGKGPSQVLEPLDTVTIAGLDQDTDTYTNFILKEMVLWEGVMPTVERKSREKKLCNDHGITFQNQFQIPV